MNILLAVDNSPHSKIAVDVIASRSLPGGSTINVFCAVERREPVFAVMSKEEANAFHNKALEIAQQFTSNMAGTLRAKFPDCNVVNEAIFGDSKEVILERAEKWPADVVVVGSHGRHGLPRLFIGSVSQTILLYGPCTTLVARYQQAHQDIPEFDKNVLVAIDDSVHSKKALEWVMKLPWPDEASFTVMISLPPLVEKYSDGIDGLYVSKYSSQRLERSKSAQVLLDDSVQLIESKLGAGRVIGLLREGDPAEEILKVASAWPAGLIVMGCRSRGHMTRLFMGSVSQEVVLQAPCPVEVVK